MTGLSAALGILALKIAGGVFLVLGLLVLGIWFATRRLP